MSDSDLSHGRGGGGGGLAGALGPEQNEFGDSSTADKAAAEALRDTYATANAAWLAEYNANRGIYILLHWTGGNEQLQHRNLDGTAWADATSIIAGPRGPLPTDAQIAAVLNASPRIPTYAPTTVAYDATANALSTSIAGVPTLTTPAILFFLAPSVLARDPDPLELRVGGYNHPLRDLFGNAVSARDITPNMLIEVIARVDNEYRIVEPLPPRPQDFAVHLYFFTPSNSATTGAPDLDDPVFTLTQAAVDGAAYHTMSSTTSPRVAWPSGYVPNRVVASGDNAYDDQFAFFTYYAVPADAPDIRGVGLGRATNYPGESSPRGWRGTLGRVLPENRVAGTFDIGGVAHKFVRFDQAITPDFEAADPPTTWESLYLGTPYSVIAFDGLPNPPITT